MNWVVDVWQWSEVDGKGRFTLVGQWLFPGFIPALLYARALRPPPLVDIDIRRDWVPFPSPAWG